MSHVDPGPMASYGSLSDPNLTAYFRNSRMRKHLIKTGLVTRRGEIVSEKVYRLNNARKEHQRHVRDLLAQAIVHKALDMERHRQMQIKKQLEEIGKVERVRRIRAERALRGDEDILPLLAPSMQRNENGKKKRPHTAPLSQSSKESKDNSDDVGTQLPQSVGYPAIPADSPFNTRSSRIKTPYPRAEIDEQYLTQLDQEALRTFTLNLSNYDLGSGVSPYKVPVLDPASREIITPRKPAKKKPKKSGRKQRPSTAIGIVRSDNRSKNLMPQTNRRSLELHRHEPPMIHRTQPRSLCIITFKYLGQIVHLDCESEDPRDEVMVDQQHCGGGNLCVFRGKLLPGNNFTIISQRHRGYPFSLTFYLNGMIAERLSACCEYKHRKGNKLGAKTSHFGFVKIEGAHPCYKCMVAAGKFRSTSDQSATKPNKFQKTNSIDKEKTTSQSKDEEPKKPKEEYADSFTSSDESSDVSSVSSITSSDDDDDEDDNVKQAKQPEPRSSTPLSQKSFNSSSKSKPTSPDLTKKISPKSSRSSSPAAKPATPFSLKKSSKDSSSSDSDSDKESAVKEVLPSQPQPVPTVTLDNASSSSSSSSSDSSSSDSSYSESSMSDDDLATHQQIPKPLTVPIRSLMKGKETIDLSNMSLDEDQVDELTSILVDESMSVESVTLYNCKLNGRNLDNILETLVFCSHLKTVNIGRNEIRNMKSLANLVESCPVETLILDGCQIADRMMENFMTDLKDLYNAEPLSDTKKPALHCLSLNKVGVGAFGIRAIAAFLAEKSTLVSLHLNGNSLTGDYVAELWKRLSDTQSILETLTLASNKLNDRGMERFSQLMSESSKLKKLDFTDNDITDTGAAHLLEFIKKNSSLERLYISRGNTIKHKTLKDIRKLLAAKKSD